MKSYVEHPSIRLVGKCWEIRKYLNLIMQNENKGLTLIEFLQKHN